MRVLLWFNSLDKFRCCSFPRRLNLSVSVLLTSVKSDPESNKSLTLKLFPFLSMPYTGKTCRNGPQRFALKNEVLCYRHDI